jgi:hypothetical protein
MVVASCSIDTIPVGLRATPAGDGPVVVFDLLARPLPDIPAPNDVATFADPTSRTGRRINASLVAPTAIESAAREQFDELEGWGTFAPITVRFARGPHVASPQAAIDLLDVQTRMRADGWDTRDDPVYVVNLTTGVPVLLDVGSGNFPTSVIDATQYFANDPRASEQNLVFETADETTGACADGVYRPSCDTDFDGVLDRPNTLGDTAGIRGVDNLLSWYERETDTLVLQPMLPMEEKTEYAVVLTDRLKGPDGRPVRSPFPYVHHPSQTASIARLQALLGDPTRGNYYGDIAGTGLDHVAFAWTFTTEPAREDLLLLRDGLYGKGPFAHLASDFPVSSAQLFPTVGKAVDAADELPGWLDDPTCARLNKTPYIAHWTDAKETLGAVIQFLFPFTQAQLDALNASLEYVDYIVLGTFDSPYLMGDPQSPDPDLHFRVNYRTGDGDVRHDPVPFMISIPKTTAQHGPPFPVAYWYHGTGLEDLEMVAHAGLYARQGIALASIDAPGHGLVLQEGQRIVLEALMKGACLGPGAKGMEASRAIDLNGDGTADSGGLIWSAHMLHTRDGTRQTVLDGMQLIRILKSFDGKALSGQDYNGDGNAANDLAGDFNGDGVVDVGGPASRYFSSGGSFGGLAAQVHGAIDPSITASAPVSGGGGFIPIALRSRLTPAPVLEQVIGPLVVAVPANARPPLAMGGSQTQCTGNQLTVRWVVNDLKVSHEVEIACLEPSELANGMTVVVTNNRSLEKRCARTGADGGFRVPVPASVSDPIDIQVYGAPDAVDAYGSSCNVLDSAPVGRHIATWEQAAPSYASVATEGLTCTASAGCAQFRQSFYPVGSQLVAPQEGYGLRRQTPDFRKLMNLAQAALDPGDPVNFAKLYGVAPPPDPDGKPMQPRALVDVHTVGDFLVPTGNGMAFSRAAGALPFLPPTAADAMPEYAPWATPRELWDSWGGRSPDQVLIDTYEMEGLARFKRTPLKPKCGVNYQTPLTSTCDAPPPDDAATCAQVLSDGDYLGEKTQDIGQPHPMPPLRLARLVGASMGTAAQVSAAWTPRILGAPFAPDGAWQPTQPLLGMLNAYLQPLGQHDWSIGDTCQAWNGTTYMDNLLVRFFATGGQDLYFLSHSQSHECLASGACSFFGGP